VPSGHFNFGHFFRLTVAMPWFPLAIAPPPSLVLLQHGVFIVGVAQAQGE